jgi:hypothetical protein
LFSQANVRTAGRSEGEQQPANKRAMLDEFFWYDDNTVRYGVAKNLYGGQQIRE